MTELGAAAGQLMRLRAGAVVKSEGCSVAV
jgi:hypothetical protein